MPVAEQIRLTERELEVLELVAKGLTNEEIARQIFRARTTARWHVCSLMKKLFASNRTEMVANAYREGLLQ